ncbi:MAG TPA: amino acid ABC transporter substrate-binding protein [Devosiaceae bacterium]
MWLWPFVLAVLALALSTGQASSQTLEKVRERGHLVCASSHALPGFAEQLENGLWAGFDVDICRAVAAAVFGDPNLVQFRPLTGDARFAQLQTGELDLLVRDAAWNLTRDTSYRVRYVATSFFDGQGILVPQSLGAVSAYELDGVKICVVDDSDELSRLRQFFFENQASYSEVLYEDPADLAIAYKAGLCNAISARASLLHAIQIEMQDPGAQRIVPERISKAPLGPVVRSDDDRWFDIVRWTLYALINAEELGVTSVNVDSMLSARNPAIRRLLGLDGDFGKPLGLSQDWMQKVIRAVGNYGEIYDRNFGTRAGVPLLRGQNALWTKGGLMYAPPVR